MFELSLNLILYKTLLTLQSSLQQLKMNCSLEVQNCTSAYFLNYLTERLSVWKCRDCTKKFTEESNLMSKLSVRK